tara:strand:- start:5610 stop:5834 length:225 start_codon:yes stop_codon:yes gene_type:complete
MSDCANTKAGAVISVKKVVFNLVRMDIVGPLRFVLLNECVVSKNKTGDAIDSMKLRRIVLIVTDCQTIEINTFI